ncbi:hypothetical protein MASR2M17_12730 [Aminivibrio sp.]
MESHPRSWESVGSAPANSRGGPRPSYEWGQLGRHKPRNEAAEARAHFMGSRGKPFAHEGHTIRINPVRARKFNIVCPAEEAAGLYRLILP